METQERRLSGPEPRQPACSVVTPTYNGRHLLATCLASVFRHRPTTGSALAVEVIVVDDASTDGTAAWVAEAYPEVRLIRRAGNGGFCAAANAGIAAARAPIIQLLNNDTEVTAGWIEEGLAPFADPTVGSVAPLVLVRSDPNLVDSAGDRYALVGWPTKRGHGQSARRWAEHPSDRIFGASGSSAFFRAEALRRVGGFDPAFGAYYEDIDLAFRLRWAGYTCVYAPRCRILHEVSASYDHTRPDLQRRMARNAEILFWTNLPMPWLLAAVGPHLGFTLAQAGWRLMQGRWKPFVLGKLDAWRAWPTLRARRRQRRDLARAAVSRPHFPLMLAPLADVGNHLRRPGAAFGPRRGRPS